MSKERLDKLWSAYTNDLKSRKKEGAKEIHIATRWSVHDVIGRLENQYGGDSRAKFIVLPALDADGESNFNYTYGVGFSRHYFEDMRNNLDEASFKALFMNQPIEREGLLYDVDELRRYFELPAEDPDAIIGICDTKDKGSDYAFLPAAYVYGNDYYIDDCICDNSLPNIVDARLVDILLRCKVKMCRFESNSAGGRVAEKVQNEVKKRGGITRITTKFTTANKETKIIVNSAWVKEHCLFKDDSLYKRQSDYGRIRHNRRPSRTITTTQCSLSAVCQTVTVVLPRVTLVLPCCSVMVGLTQKLEQRTVRMSSSEQKRKCSSWFFVSVETSAVSHSS